MKNILYIGLPSFQNHRIPKCTDNDTEMMKQTQLFQKYFPKYLKKFSFVSKNGSTISKLKRTKIIQNFEASTPLWRNKNWRLILATKSKTVRILNSNQTSFQFPEKIRFLSNLRIIHITMPPPTAIPFTRMASAPDKKLDFYLTKSCRMMDRLRNLRSLTISKLSTNHKNLLISLNKSSRFLISLQKFSLLWGEEMTPSSNYNLLYAMPNHKNLSKYVTNLDLGTLCYPAHFFNFKYLANSVPQLLRLAFRYAPPKISSKGVDSYLEALGRFSNLKSLDMRIADLFMFFKDFVAPPGVQHLKLLFEECFTKDVMRKFSKDFDKTSALAEREILKIFQENQILPRFCKSLQGIHSLRALEIAWNWDSSINTSRYQDYFSQYMLQGIASLENLTDKMSGSNVTSIQNNHLSAFFESCLSSRHTLKTLEVGNENIEFTQFDLSGLERKFTKLSTIKVTGQFSQDNDVYLLLRQLVLLRDSIQQIKLQAILIENMESFVSFVQRINQLEKPSQIKIEVQVKLVNDLKPEDIDELIKFVRSSQKDCSAEGVYFKLLTPLNHDTSLINTKKILRHACQENFKNFEAVDSVNFY